MSSIIVPVFQPPLRHTNTGPYLSSLLHIHREPYHPMASVDNRLSKHGGENAPFQSRFTKQETYDWHRICLRATEIMPSVTHVKE